MRFLLVSFAILLLVSCKNTPKVGSDTDASDTLSVREIKRTFNQDSAYQYILNQLAYGPRVPGTDAHKNCFDYLLKRMVSFADTVYTQHSSAVTFDKKTIPVMNIIGSFRPDAEKRILLCAHWDTRPFADQDIKDKDKPFPGANDGASGTAVLLEIASVLKNYPPDYGIDIIFFDAEDWGDPEGEVEDSYCLGSQHWSQNTHVKNYKAEFGILLDMVGAPNAVFGFEGYSLNEAPSYLSMVWAKAEDSGYGKYFKNFQRGYVTDDHFYVIKHTGIPMIDIIDSDPSTKSMFGKYWHTHNDNIDAIDKNTLKAVGQTVLNVIGSYTFE